MSTGTKKLIGLMAHLLVLAGSFYLALTFTKDIARTLNMTSVGLEYYVVTLATATMGCLAGTIVAILGGATSLSARAWLREEGKLAMLAKTPEEQKLLFAKWQVGCIVRLLPLNLVLLGAELLLISGKTNRVLAMAGFTLMLLSLIAYVGITILLHRQSSRGVRQ